MTTFQTYGDRSGAADPYVARGKRGGQRAFDLRLDSFHNHRVHGSARSVTIGLASVSLSPIKISISHSQAENLQGLTEILRRVVTAVRAQSDPYVEIEEPSRLLIGKAFEQKLVSVLELTPTRQLKKKTSLEEFLAPVLRLEKLGRIDTALDALYDRVDDLLKSEDFPALGAMLRQADVESLSTDILLGLLTATLPARSKLPARAQFFAEAEASIKSRDEWEDGLLAGLES